MGWTYSSPENRSYLQKRRRRTASRCSCGCERSHDLQAPTGASAC